MSPSFIYPPKIPQDSPNRHLSILYISLLPHNTQPKPQKLISTIQTKRCHKKIIIPYLHSTFTIHSTTIHSFTHSHSHIHTSHIHTSHIHTSHIHTFTHCLALPFFSLNTNVNANIHSHAHSTNSNSNT